MVFWFNKSQHQPQFQSQWNGSVIFNKQRTATRDDPLAVETQ